MGSHTFLLLLSLCVWVCVEGALPGLKVSGNKIVDTTGKTVTLRGVNRSGAEFACVQGNGIFDGPSDQASITAMKTWNINVVRIPLNEDCWLNINGVKANMSGTAYITAVSNFINLFIQNNIYVIIDLHWTASGSTLATGQQAMPDRDHSVDFWKAVATYFKGNNAVIFDLFNEPYPNGGTWDDANAWNCYRNGGSACSGLSFTAAGMQDLVTAVRGTGSTNIVMTGGLAWSNSLAQWIKYEVNDTLGQVAASWHSYNFNQCNNQNCWQQYVLPVAQKVPVIIGESGENDCAHNYVDQLYTWADQQGIHYLGWTWNTWNCTSGPALISDYSGKATGYGDGIKNHLAKFANLD